MRLLDSHAGLTSRTSNHGLTVLRCMGGTDRVKIPLPVVESKTAAGDVAHHYQENGSSCVLPRRRGRLGTVFSRHKAVDIGLGAIAISRLCQGLRLIWIVLMHHGRVFTTLSIHGGDGEGEVRNSQSGGWLVVI